MVGFATRASRNHIYNYRISENINSLGLQKSGVKCKCRGLKKTQVFGEKLEAIGDPTVFNDRH